MHVFGRAIDQVIDIVDPHLRCGILCRTGPLSPFLTSIAIRAPASDSLPGPPPSPPLHRLFLGGIGNDNAALLGFFLLHGLDDHPVAQGLHFGNVDIGSS